ncbi:hypothetical protein [Phocaeicola sp.]
MKKFLKYICLFSSVIIVLSIGFEIMLRHIPNAYVFKRHVLEEKGMQIKNMIIGSSVVHCSINPAYLPDSTYNMSISGQWFRYNQMLLEKYIDQLPHLQTVIWGVCYQALWYDDCVELDKGDVVYHKIYLDISSDENILHNMEVIATGSVSCKKWSKYYLLHRNTMTCDSLGLDHGYSRAEKKHNWLEDIPGKVKGHTAAKDEKSELVFHQNLQRMHEVAKLCHDRGIDLCFVFPPVHENYYKLVDIDQMSKIDAALQEVTDKWDNVYYYDYFEDERFEGDDFFDGNHLTSDIGAIKFTKILRKDIWGNKGY